jgi:energy-coupling factor transport system ATP-binding protein
MASASLSGLSFRYAAASDDVLREVTLLLDGGLVLVAGSSGSGKSTLLRVLNGLVPHFHGGSIGGRAIVAGLDVLRTPTRLLAREVGFVFQDPETQMVGGSVEREVAFGLENLGVAAADARRRVGEALELCGLDALRGRAVATLSGGERQRVAVAASVAMGCGILALDEPTSQLDAQGAAAVTSLCAALAARGTTVVVAEHRMERLLPVAASVVVCEAGRVAGPGAPRRLARRLAAPPQVVELGIRAGWDPLPLTVDEVRATLRRTPAPPNGARHRPVGGEQAWALRGVVAGPHTGSPIVEGVDVVGHAGEVVALVGPNGGGKTTLLRTLSGLIPPIAGDVWRRPGRVAHLPQNPGAVLHLPTVRAEVELTLRRLRDTDDVDALLALLGLGALATRHPRDLSSGERQRAAIAALLCGHPALAVLDEPTRGMDAAARRALTALVVRLAGQGAAVVLATHDADLAAALADRVVEVRERAVRDLGPPRHALTTPSPYATQLGELWQSGPTTVAEALLLL